MVSEAYTFTYNCKVIHNENRTVIGNNKTGEWIKISKQCFNILTLGIENSLSPAQLIDCLEDLEDKLYFEDLFEKLYTTNLVIEKSRLEDSLNRLNEVYFALTNKCNLHCSHCCYNAEFTSLLSPEEKLKTAEIIMVIDKIIEAIPKRIVFSGGEPMLRSDLFEILSYTRSHYNGQIALSTNATFITPHNVEKLTLYIDSFDISLDGVDEKSCSMLRGRGVYDKVIKSIDLLKKSGVEKIALSMVLTEKNKHLQGEFRELNKRLGTRAVIRDFNPIGRGENLKNSMRQKESIDMVFSNEQVKKISNNITMSTCGAGKNTLLIDYDGSIYPCGILISEKYKIAQVSELDNLDQLSNPKTIEANRGLQSLMKLQPDRYHKCKDCSVNLFCWSCIQQIELYGKSKDLFEERCATQKKFLNRIIWNSEEVNV